jgi:hypothetical protein
MLQLITAILQQRCQNTVCQSQAIHHVYSRNVKRKLEHLKTTLKYVRTFHHVLCTVITKRFQFNPISLMPRVTTAKLK